MFWTKYGYRSETLRVLGAASMFVTRLQRSVTRQPPGLAATVLWVLIAVALPTMLRAALSRLLGDRLVFPTYYPAALLATLYLGYGAGILVVLTSALVVNILFMPPHLGLALGAQDVAGTIMFVFAACLIVLMTALLRTALCRLDRANELERMLNTELNHRLRNSLTIVDALVSQTATRTDARPREIADILRGRRARQCA